MTDTSPEAPPPRHRLTVPINEDDHVVGSLNAPVHLVEYGDYQCPYSGAAFAFVGEVQRRLGNRLLFVFRQFPIVNTHRHTLRAAEAAEAAAAQGAFWRMHELLYMNQRALHENDLFAYADALGLDMRQFTDDMNVHRHIPRIRADIGSGTESGVNGTPTFYVNGVRHDGSYDPTSLVNTLVDTFARAHTL